MTILLWYLAVLAATMLIVGSATVNAMFLSSLGRTPVEAAVYGAVSIAADIAKVVLPIAIAAAVAARVWLQASLASLLLLGVIGLSLTSGTGFASLTRGTVTAAREAAFARLAALEAERAALLARLSPMQAAREPAIVAAALDAVNSDRRWQQSGQCRTPSGAAAREFCAEAHRLRIEHATASERARLGAEELALRQRIEALRADGRIAGADPQVEALAALVGVSAERLRAALGFGIAVVLELGAVVLVLIVASPLLRLPQKPEAGERPEDQNVKAVELPPQVDRLFWERRRRLRGGHVIGGGDDHARG